MRLNLAIVIMTFIIILFDSYLSILTKDQIKIGAASEKTDGLFSRLIKEKEPGGPS